MPQLEEITYSLPPRELPGFDFDRGQFFRIAINEIQDVEFDRNNQLTCTLADQIANEFAEQLMLDELSLEDVYRAATVVKRYMMRVISVERQIELREIESIGFIINWDDLRKSKPIIVACSHEEILQTIEKWNSN